MKRITVFLVLSMCLMLFTFSACGEKNMGSGPDEVKVPTEEIKEDKKLKYSVVDCVKGNIEIVNIHQYSTLKELILIDSPKQLAEYAVDDKYDVSFFETNALVLMKFFYNSSEENIEFKSLIANDNKLYALFELDGRKSDEAHCDDIICNLYSAEIGRDLLDNYVSGNILTVNRREIGSPAGYHEIFNGIIE